MVVNGLQCLSFPLVTRNETYLEVELQRLSILAQYPLLGVQSLRRPGGSRQAFVVGRSYEKIRRFYERSASRFFDCSPEKL